MEAPQKSDLVAQRKIRLEKRNRLEEGGMNPYPADIDFSRTLQEVGENFKDGEEVGDVTKINDKTFTVEFGYNGDTIKRAIQFHRFVGKAIPGAEAEEVPA